jgi:hypothetical protein
MLHRRFLFMETTSTNKDIFAYSRKACLDASLGMLDIQHTLDEETCPGGQLHMMRWRVSSLLNHQFLTATMILCSLHHRGLTLERKEEIIKALRDSRTAWMRASSTSQEANKATRVISFVLAKAGDLHDYSMSLDHPSHVVASVGKDALSNLADSDVGAAFDYQADLQPDINLYERKFHLRHDLI